MSLRHFQQTKKEKRNYHENFNENLVCPRLRVCDYGSFIVRPTIHLRRVREFLRTRYIARDLQPDPSGAIGLPVPVLVYNLAFSVIPGDVVMTEPGSPAGSQQDSDIVRFWNPTGGGPSQIIFYSDFSATDPADSPADTGMPPGSMPPCRHHSGVGSGGKQRRGVYSNPESAWFHFKYCPAAGDLQYH